MTRLVVPLRVQGKNGEQTSIHAPDVDASATPTQTTAYLNAILGITNGLNGQVKMLEETLLDGPTVGVVPPDAWIGVKWVCRYQDNDDGSVATLEIPAADYTLLTSGNKLDLTTGAGAAFKTAFETVVLSKPQPGTDVGGGNAVTLLDVTFRSRTF